MHQITPELGTRAVAVVLTAGILWTLHLESNRAISYPEVKGPGIALSLGDSPPAAGPPKSESPPGPTGPKPEPPRPRAPEKPVHRRMAQVAAAVAGALVPRMAEPDPGAGDSQAAVVMGAEAADSAGSGASSATGGGSSGAGSGTGSGTGGSANFSIEAAYAAALRQNVDKRTTLPTSAEYRLLKPSGATRVRFVLDRLGGSSEVAVARTSGSHILDRQAVDIVASGRYPPFPEAAFRGETRHVFIVTIEFRS